MPGDLCAGAAQGGSDLVDLQLNDRATLTLLRFVGALREAPLNDDAHALTKGLGDVLSDIAPQGAAHEDGVSIAPFAGVAVVGSRGGGHREVSDCGAGLCPAECRVGGQVTDEGDECFAAHSGSSSFSSKGMTVNRIEHIGMPMRLLV